MELLLVEEPYLKDIALAASLRGVSPRHYGAPGGRRPPPTALAVRPPARRGPHALYPTLPVRHALPWRGEGEPAVRRLPVMVTVFNLFN